MKHKSNSGAKKRFRLTGTGKVMAQKSCKNHLLVNKSKRQKKLNNKGMRIMNTEERIIKSLLS
jgi:large subunit ribosomal protein L35